jgi:PIN domain nuclease of toxin-antitoxin system
VRYLLDTGIFIWSAGLDDRLDQATRELLAGEQEIYLSAASAWEIAIKYALGKLNLPEPPATFVPSRVKLLGLRPLPISQSHALAIGNLPRHHNDPFDRLLIAQAMSEQMVLMTADKLFSQYSVQTLWCGTYSP